METGRGCVRSVGQSDPYTSGHVVKPPDVGISKSHVELEMTLPL